MKLRSIHLENFRSYKKINLKIENNKFIVLTGKNGIGKTNLLEAISFLSPGKGFKNCRLDEVINTNTNLKQCSIFFVIENGNEKNEIGISFANESTGNRIQGRKIIYLNGKKLKKIRDEELYAYNVYQIEGEGRSLFSKIEGDENTIMGLPIKQIKEYLIKYE